MTAAATQRRWRRWWAGYAAAAFGIGVAADTYAYLRHGWSATLTAALRCWSGCEPPARHGPVGRAAMVGFLLWAAAHLGTGRYGPSRGRPPC